MSNKVQQLIAIYKQMEPKALQEEINALFDICFAMLESQDCDSIEQFPNPDIRIKISCEVIKNESGFYN
jgi:hypothetical protein